MSDKSLKPETPVQFIKGIGPKRAAKLARLGINTLEDLLFHIPSRYIDRSNPVPVAQAKVGEEGTFVVKVLGSTIRRTRKGYMIQILAGDDSAQIYALWFNRPDLKGKFKPGEKLLISGQVSFYDRMQMVNPFFERLDENPDFFENPVFAVYPLTEGLSAWEIRRAVTGALGILDEMAETLPQDLLMRHDLPTIGESLKRIHHPVTMKDIDKGLKRLRYEELFFFELLVGMRRTKLEYAVGGQVLDTKGEITEKFLNKLPFMLTGDQRKVIEEIDADVSIPRPMHRLLQGDVGSGKTVVAIFAMLAATQSGKQAAMMVPTEILAEQHYNNWNQLLKTLGANPLLLTGSIKNSDKELLREKIASGEADIVFGTHSLIEENARFRNLALVVVDEQHRFGVMQKAALTEKGGAKPHVLVMSATPIPRTLTLSYFGDLDVSIIREKPRGRAERKTELTSESRRYGIYNWLKQRMEKGDRAFVVCPLIEESEKLELSSAQKTYEELTEILGGDRLGLIHGRMKYDDRTRAMDEFRSGDIQVLVSTTVIEVGVDVPEATIMLIRHPERFGLAQLHQLRGRIGRGEKPATCVLITGDRLSPEAMERLRFFAGTEDGFALARKDLEIRGPGQILGTRQHGLPDLRLANLVRDQELLEKAREDAFSILAKDPNLVNHPRVAATVRRRHSANMEFLGVA